jgi:hypothetical protein
MNPFILNVLVLLVVAIDAASIRDDGVEGNNNHFRHIMHNHSLTDPEKFYQLALSCSSVTDKVSAPSSKRHHKYQLMYGTFLLPYVRRQWLLNKPIKFFEIGLGCNKYFGMFIVWLLCYFKGKVTVNIFMSQGA